MLIFPAIARKNDCKKNGGRWCVSDVLRKSSLGKGSDLSVRRQALQAEGSCPDQALCFEQSVMLEY